MQRSVEGIRSYRTGVTGHCELDEDLHTLSVSLGNVKSQSPVGYRVMEAYFSAVKFENKASPTPKEKAGSGQS